MKFSERSTNPSRLRQWYSQCPRLYWCPRVQPILDDPVRIYIQ